MKSASQIQLDIITFLPDNTTEEISAKDVRDRLIDLNASVLNVLDGGVINSIISYNSEKTLTDRKQIAYKGYIDDSLAALSYNFGTGFKVTGGSNVDFDTSYIDIANKTLKDGAFINRYNWHTNIIKDDSNRPRADFNNAEFYDSASNVAFSFEYFEGYGAGHVRAIGWYDRRLYNNSDVAVYNWQAGIIYDGAGDELFLTNARTLNIGSDVQFSWATLGTLETICDLNFTDKTKGPILIDRTTNLPLRIYINSGVILTESA